MRAALYLGLVLAANLAAAETQGPEPRPSDQSSTAPVVGGADAPDGKWPDAVGVLFAGQVGCTGVLIAPTVVMTAGHCIDGSIDGVLIGTATLAEPGDGETISVIERIEYPNSWNSYDVGVLVLASPSRFAPRPIATDWARADIVDGAAVAIVGYGATDRDGEIYVDELQEATSIITDADCSTEGVGCNLAARPSGELGAGGMGIDSCPGDSGGPLYLLTDYGAFLVGITSRGYDTSTFYCSEGGIYTRPDALVAWIEQATGVTLPRGAAAHAPRLVVEAGGVGDVTIDPADPRDNVSHRFAVRVTPSHGEATVDADGVVTYTADADYLGSDRLVVAVTDASQPDRESEAVIEIEVVEELDDGGGCCSTGDQPALGSLLLALGLATRLRRRRVSVPA